MKLKHIFLAFCGIAAACACDKDLSPAENDGLVSFNASFVTSDTKTVLEGYSPRWTSSDKILVFDGQNNLFVTDVAAPSATAEFKGKLAGKERKHYFAVCPYTETATFSFMSSYVYALTLPSQQVAVKGSFDPAAGFSFAYSEDNNLVFKNLISLIKLTIASDGVTSVEVTPTGDEMIAGKFNAQYAESPAVKITKGENKVVLKGDFEKGAVYYIATLPSALKNGLKVTLNGETIAKKVTSPVTLERSGVVDLGLLSLTPSETPDPDPENPDPENPDPVTENVTVYVEGTYWHIWMWGPEGENLVGCDWHGPVKDGDKTIDGVTYSYFIIKDSKSYIGQKARLLFIADGYNVDGSKTKDSDEFTIAKDMYFYVDESGKPVLKEADSKG